MADKMKPEDVMSALECCAGTFLCDECPRKKDGYHCVKNLVKDALALLREKDARIEHLEKTMRESILSNAELLKNLNKLVEEKDAEIERLGEEIRELRHER